MAGPLAPLQRIVNEILLELGVALDRTASQLVAPHGFDYVAGVFEAVDVTELASVVGGDRHFLDVIVLVVELDNDLRIEVEIIGHPGKVDVLQGVQIVSPVAAMKLRQVKAQNEILKAGQNAIAGVLIKRHPSLERSAVVLHHARAEYGVGLSPNDRIVHVGEDLRSVLSVPVQQDNNIEAFLEEVR